MPADGTGIISEAAERRVDDGKSRNQLYSVEFESAGLVSGSTAIEAALKTRSIVPPASEMENGTPMRGLYAVVTAPAQVCFLMNPLVALTSAVWVTAKSVLSNHLQRFSGEVCRTLPAVRQHPQAPA